MSMYQSIPLDDDSAAYVDIAWSALVPDGPTVRITVNPDPYDIGKTVYVTPARARTIAAALIEAADRADGLTR